MTIVKEIVYDLIDCDFAMYLDGEYVGSRRSKTEAEAELDRLAFELIGFMAGWDTLAAMQEAQR